MMTVLSRESRIPALTRGLKQHLKAQGLRHGDIAERLGVGVATVKRWLAGEGLTTARLEELCALARIDLFDLVESVGRAEGDRQDRFTSAQERILGRDPALFFIFFSLLNGWPLDECGRELSIPPEAMVQHLTKLERLGLIDVLAGGRIRVLAARGVSWRKDGPLAKYFEARKSFVDIGRGDEALYISDFVRLTDSGVAQIRSLMDEVRREVHRIAMADRRATAAERNWYGMLFFVRPLNMEAIRRAIAAPGANS